MNVRASIVFTAHECEGLCFRVELVVLLRMCTSVSYFEGTSRRYIIHSGACMYVCMYVFIYFCFNMSPRGDQVDQAWKVTLVDRYARTCQGRLHILSTYRPFDPLDAQALEHPPQSCFCLGLTAPTFPPPDLYCSSSSSTAFMMLSTIDASRRIDRPPGRMTIPVNSILCSSRLV